MLPWKSNTLKERLSINSEDRKLEGEMKRREILDLIWWKAIWEVEWIIYPAEKEIIPIIPAEELADQESDLVPETLEEI